MPRAGVVMSFGGKSNGESQTLVRWLLMDGGGVMLRTMPNLALPILAVRSEAAELEMLWRWLLMDCGGEILRAMPRLVAAILTGRRPYSVPPCCTI